MANVTVTLGGASVAAGTSLSIAISFSGPDSVTLDDGGFGGTFDQSAFSGDLGDSFSAQWTSPHSVISESTVTFGLSGGDAEFSGSNQAQVTPVAPDAPTGFTALAASTTSINLAWSSSADNITGFFIEQSLNGSTGWEEAINYDSADTGLRSATITGLSPGTKYYFRIQAINGAGGGDQAAANATTASASAPPRAGLNLGLSLGL